MSGADPRPPDNGVLGHILTALDAGVPPDVDALVKAVPASDETIRCALDALRAYHVRLEAERRQGPAAPQPDAPGAVLPAGTRLGSFVVESVLGCGGMSVVYRARQTDLGDRTVALKVLPRTLVARDHKFAERFRREATLAARIDHPGIAKIHSLEEVGGDLCFAMQLVEGPTLHEVLARLARDHQGERRPTSLEHIRRCVQLARTLADALAKIHEHGLVHRDVKPSNVILASAAAPGTDPLLARPVLVDFGLLRPAGQTELTGHHTTLGTPAYASPDALLGRELDARADVFSLAATLHDLVTVTLPNSRAPASAGLPDPRSINPSIDERLAAILAMALHEQKALRYGHAGALRDELDRYLRGEPVHALPTSALERFRLWVRRDRARALAIAASSLIGIVLSVLLAMLGSWLWRTERIARLAAEAERAGRLTDASDLYSAFAHEPGTALLFWLDETRHRSRVHWRDGAPLHAAVQHLRVAEGALALGQAGESVAEYEFERANDRLLETLLDDRHRPVAPAIHAFYRRELLQAQAEVRVRIALESLADYQLVTKLPLSLPDDVFALVRGIAIGDGAWRQETREAAMSVLATTRSATAFAALVDALQGDLTRPLALIAVTGSWHVFCWLHRDDPAAYSGIGAAVLGRWSDGTERQALRYDPTWMYPVARLLAWWERSPEGPLPERGPLSLSDAMRRLVTGAQKQQAADWQLGAAVICGTVDPNTVLHPYHLYMLSSGRGATDYEDQIWCVRADDDTRIQFDATQRDPSPAWNGIRFARGSGPKERLGGTVRSAWYRAGSIQDWENESAPPFLKLDRPGHSAVQWSTTVPTNAIGLEIRVSHMVGARPVLRQGGIVAFQLRIVGTAWKQQSAIDATHAVTGQRSVATVDRHVFEGRDQLDVVLEYLHGNTTYRVSGIELVWSFPPK